MFPNMPIWLELLLALAVAFVLSFAATPIVKSFARIVGAMDVPKDSRRMHKTPIPRMGGLAIFFGFTDFNMLEAPKFTGFSIRIRLAFLSGNSRQSSINPSSASISSLTAALPPRMYISLSLCASKNSTWAADNFLPTKRSCLWAADADKLSAYDVDSDKKGSARNVVIIGAGYIGVELAEAFERLGKKVTLIDAENRIMSKYLDKEFSDIAEKEFTEKTVKVSGNFEDNISLLAFIANRYNTKDELYVAILDRKDRDVKYAMFDYDFMKNGFILNDDETEE